MTKAPRFGSVVVGTALSPLVKPAITTRQLVEYAGASLDFNRIHYDETFAKAGNFPSVIAHGMLSMAFVGEAATRFAGEDPTRVIALKAKFKAVTFPGEVITITGTVLDKNDASKTMTLGLTCKKSDGTVTLEAEAVVKLD